MELLPVKSGCYALLRPTNDPDMVVPARAVVEDIAMDPVLPVYKLRVVSIYENVFNFRRHFARAYWRCRSMRPTLLHVPPKALVSEDALNTWLCDRPLLFHVEYPFVFKSKSEMIGYFNRLQEYVLAKTVRRLRDVLSRREYSGRLKINDHMDFDGRMWQAFADKFGSRDEFGAWMKQVGGPRVYRKDANRYAFRQDKKVGRRGGT